MARRVLRSGKANRSGVRGDGSDRKKTKLSISSLARYDTIIFSFSVFRLARPWLRYNWSSVAGLIPPSFLIIPTL